jgi:hypothetical protein
MIELYHIMKSPERFSDFMKELNETVMEWINPNVKKTDKKND